MTAAKAPAKTLAKGEIVLRDVCKSYGPRRFATEVIEDCSFTAPAGQITVMIGPSGAGKSTLVRLIAGFEKPSSGQILIDRRPITGPGRDRLVVFQETALFPWMHVDDNTLFGPRARGEVDASIRGHADFLIEKVGLAAFRKHFPRQLSGGMQRRAELARALINNPDAMILDEPFRGLDAMMKKLMLEYYARLCAEQSRTNLFVTTDIDEAIFLADRLLVMSHKPMQVRSVIDVDLTRPRRANDLFHDARANEIRMEALSLLHEETMKGFAGAGKAADDFIEAYRRRLSAG